MNWSWLKSIDKVTWLNILTVLATILGYIIDNKLAPAWVPWLGLGVVIVNAITIILKNQTIKQLKQGK